MSALADCSACAYGCVVGPDDRLLQDLDGFFTEHRGCGDLAGGLDEVSSTRYVVWFECRACAAQIARRAIDACDPR